MIRQRSKNPDGFNRKWLKFPLTIQIGTNNYCGLKYCGVLCEYCYPQWMIQRGVHKYQELPLEYIEWIAREARRDGKGILNFWTTFLDGDGLTDDRLPSILRLLKYYMPHTPTQTFTCGTLTNKAGMLIDRNLDEICFTISGHNAEVYKAVHKGDHFQDAINTLLYCVDNKLRHQKIQVHCVLTKHNIQYARQWWEFFGNPRFGNIKRVLSPLVGNDDNLPSAMALGNTSLADMENVVKEIAGFNGLMWTRDYIQDYKPCVLWDNDSINANGDYLQCCNWADTSKWNYGNIRQFIDEGRHLTDIHIEKVANKMRNPICRSCNMKHRDWQRRLNAIKLRGELLK